MADWDKLSTRGEVEDRRGNGPAIMGGISLTGVAVVLAINFLMGGNVTDVLQTLQSMPTTTEETQQTDKSQFAGQDSYEVFASTILGSNNDMYKKIFSGMGRKYVEPKLVLFRTATQSLCGGATSDVGPHYCPEDMTIYLDETFFDELTQKLGAGGGDVAQAYVIAHETGHHAQNLLGILRKVHDNTTSVKSELQADCFAGMWANSILDKQVLKPGEINEALDAAAAVGDDRIQKMATGRINPETFTHGSSKQRVDSFNTGYASGEIGKCNTF